MNHSIIVVGNRPCLTILRTMTRSSYPEGCQQCSPTVQGVARNYSTEPNAGVTTTGPLPPQESSSETGVRNITRTSERSKRLSKGRKEMLEGMQDAGRCERKNDIAEREEGPRVTSRERKK